MLLIWMEMYAKKFQNIVIYSFRLIRYATFSSTLR